MPRIPLVRTDGVGQIIHAADINGVDAALGQFTSGVYHALETSNGGAADPTGATDSTAALQGKLSAAPAGSVLMLPPGTFLVSNLTSVTNHKIVGAGRNKTILKAKSGSTGTLLSHSSAWGELRDFDIDLTAAPSMDGLVCSATNEVQLANIRVLYGARGIAVTGASGSCYYDRLYCKNQTTAGVQINEGGAEHHFGVGCQVLVDDPAITMQAGVEWSRTAVTDLGGWYGQEVRVTRSAGTIVHGYALHSTAVSGGLGSFAGIFGCPLIADNINGGSPFFIQNMDNARFALPWATGSSGAAFLLDGATRIQFDQWFASCPGGAFDFAATNQASDKIEVGAGICTQGYVLHMPASGRPTNLSWSPEIAYDNATGFTNDWTALMGCVPGNSSFRRQQSPMVIPTLDTAGGAQCFAWMHAPTGAHYYVRIDSSGKLQLLPDAFNLVALLLDQNGDLQINGNVQPGGSGGARIYSGSGAPLLPNGAASIVAGSFYLRTDTPSTANQRIYVCQTGGSSPTWIGIV